MLEKLSGAQSGRTVSKKKKKRKFIDLLHKAEGCN